jgi:hypothetical protein
MAKRIHLFIVLLSFFAFIGSCSDPSSNEDTGGKIKVLILSNFEGGNTWIDTSYVKYMDNISFSSFNIADSIPTLSDFVGYDVILLYEDGIFDEAMYTGDSLYYYVMAGGNLVIGTFYWQDRTSGGYGSSAATWGMLESIDPLYGGSCVYEYDSLGVTENHPLTKGVNSLVTYYRGGSDSLRANATAVAWWFDGDVLMAYNKPNGAGTITSVTAAPQEGFYWDWRGRPNKPDGDFFTLWENVLKWTGAQGNGFSLAASQLLKSTGKLKKQPVDKQMPDSRPSGGKRID